MNITFKKRGFGQHELWVDDILKARVGPTIGKFELLGNWRVQLLPSKEAIHTKTLEGAMDLAERRDQEAIDG